VEGSETPLQRDVRGPGSADEADRTGASAIGGGRPLLGLRPQALALLLMAPEFQRR
jgi:hypothetical protein